PPQTNAPAQTMANGLRRSRAVMSNLRAGFSTGSVIGLISAAAAVRGIPDLDDLGSGIAALADQQPRQSAVDLPPPALAAARPLLLGVRHGVVVGGLLARGQWRGIV